MASPRGQDQHAGVLVAEPGRRRGRYGRAAGNRRATDAAFFLAPAARRRASAW
jgi:hypothetical protein